MGHEGRARPPCTEPAKSSGAARRFIKLWHDWRWDAAILARPVRPRGDRLSTSPRWTCSPGPSPCWGGLSRARPSRRSSRSNGPWWVSARLTGTRLFPARRFPAGALADGRRLLPGRGQPGRLRAFEPRALPQQGTAGEVRRELDTMLRCAGGNAGLQPLYLLAGHHAAGLDLGQKHDWQPMSRPAQRARMGVPRLGPKPEDDPDHTMVPCSRSRRALGEGTLDTSCARRRCLAGWRWGSCSILAVIKKD